MIILRGIVEGNLWKLRDRRRLRAETQALLRTLYKERVEAEDLAVQHFLLGTRVTEAGLAESISQSVLQKETMRLLAENLVTDLGTAIDTVGRRVDDVFRKEGLRAAQDVAAGGEESPVNKRMRERLVRQGITSFTDSAGRNWSLTHYASMSVKTVTSQAQNTATKLTLVERGFDVVEINSVNDPCKLCLPFNGKEVSLTGETEGLLVLEDIPPFHPECRHFIFPNERTLEERARKLEVVLR